MWYINFLAQWWDIAVRKTPISYPSHELSYRHEPAIITIGKIISNQNIWWEIPERNFLSAQLHLNVIRSLVNYLQTSNFTYRILDTVVSLIEPLHFYVLTVLWLPLHRENTLGIFFRLFFAAASQNNHCYKKFLCFHHGKNLCSSIL